MEFEREKKKDLKAMYGITSFHSNPKEGNAKECSNYCTTALISHNSKGMLKFSKPGFNSMRTVNFQMFKLDLENTGTRDQIANIRWIIKKARVPEKHLILLY